MWTKLWINVVLYCSLHAISNGQMYEGDQVIRVAIGSKAELNEILSMVSSQKSGVQIWSYPTKFTPYLDLQISAQEILNIKTRFHKVGITYETMIPNLEALIKSQTIKAAAKNAAHFQTLEEFDYSIYHDAEEIEKWMTVAQNQFPNKVKKIQVGVSYQGRPINALEMSDSTSSTNKSAIYIDTLIHSREWITAASVMFIFKEILTNTENSWILGAVDWYFIPMLNVDGYIYSWTEGNRLWRKTRSQGASKNCFGIDANRNFDDHWGEEGSSREPCSNLFHGQFAASESEVRHIAKFILKNKAKIKAVITVHSFAQLIMYPYNYAMGAYPENNIEQNNTAKLMSEAMYRVHNVTYNYGAAAETLYVSTGITTDWTQAKAEIDINYTIELRDTGQYGFLLPADQIIPTGEELFAGIKVLVEHISNTSSNSGSGDGIDGNF